MQNSQNSQNLITGETNYRLSDLDKRTADQR